MTVTPLRYVCTVNDETLPASTDSNYEFTYCDVTSVQTGHVKIPETTTTFSQAPSRARRIARPGDVVYATIRPNLKATALVPQVETPLIVSTAFAVLRPKEGLLPKYLAYAVQDGTFTHQLSRSAVGVSYPAIDEQTVKAARIPVPDMESQRRIVEFLDAELEQIDALTAEQERLVSLLIERRVALADVIMESIEADLVKLRFLFAPRNERANGDEEVLSVYRDYGVIPKNSRSDNHNVTPEDLSNYRRVSVGDLVVNKMKAWQGSVAISDFEGIVSGDYQVLRPITTRFSSQFAHHILRSSRMIREYRIRSKGIRPSQWRLYWEDLADIRVPVPDLPVQESIERRFVDIAEQDPVGESLKSLRQLLEERRAALITAAVTGELEV